MDSQDFLIIKLKNTNPSHQQLFSNQKKADIILTLNHTNTTFALHSEICKRNSHFFLQREYQKSINLSQDFKDQQFSKILSLLYGFTLKINRNDIFNYFKIVSFLKIYPAIEIIKNDMTQNLIEYDIFRVIQLASTYKMNDLLDQCLRQLLNQDFQQINYNIFDLLSCSEEVFRLVINYHNKMRSQRATQGLTWEKIQQTVKQYCDANNLPTTNAKRLLHELVDHKELFLEQNQKKQGNRVQIGNIQVNQLGSRQNIAKPTSNKMTQSLIGRDGIGSVFPSTPPVRGSPFYSHIWESQQKGNLVQKPISFTTAKQSNTNKILQSQNRSSDNPFQSKRNAFEINQVGQDEQSQQFKKHHIKVKPVQRFATQPISDVNVSQNDIPKINFSFNNPNTESQMFISSDRDKNGNIFKKFQQPASPINANNLNNINSNINNNNLSVITPPHVRKLSQHAPRGSFQNLNIRAGNQLNSPIEPNNRRLSNVLNVQSPLTPKQNIHNQREQSPPTFGNRNQMPDISPTPSSGKNDSNIKNQQQSPISDKLKLFSNKSQQKPVKIHKIGKPKQSLQQMAKTTTLRKDSIQLKDVLNEKKSQQSRPSISHSQLLKQIEALNKLALQDKQSNTAMSHQIDRIKGQLAHSNKKNINQKHHLMNIQKNIEILELQFKKTDTQFYTLATKIDDYARKRKIVINHNQSVYQNY